MRPGVSYDADRSSQPTRSTAISATDSFSKWQSVAVVRRARLLETGPAHAFRDWPNPHLPRVAAGAYTIWEGDRLLYSDQAGDRWSIEDRQRRRNAAVPRGLYRRLRLHALGRRNADPFCVMVANRIVLPRLSRAEIKDIAEGSGSLDAKIAAYLNTCCTYRFEVLDDTRLIRRVVTMVRQGYLNAGKPLLNPLTDQP